MSSSFLLHQTKCVSYSTTYSPSSILSITLIEGGGKTIGSRWLLEIIVCHNTKLPGERLLTRKRIRRWIVRAKGKDEEKKKELCANVILSYVFLYSSDSANRMQPMKDLQYVLKTNSVTINRKSYHWVNYHHTHWGTTLLCAFDTLIEPIYRYLAVS